MKLRVSTMVLLAATASAISFSSLPAKETRSEKSSQELARALQGRAAGQPVTCIPNVRGQARMQVIDEQTILFEEGNTVYLQRTQSACHGIDDGDYTLVTRLYGGQRLCSGDIQQLVQLNTGIFGGSCVMGPFVPYRKVG